MFMYFLSQGLADPCVVLQLLFTLDSWGGISVRGQEEPETGKWSSRPCSQPAKRIGTDNPSPAPCVPYLPLFCPSAVPDTVKQCLAQMDIHPGAAITQMTSGITLTDGRSEEEPLPPMQAGRQTFLLWQLEQRQRKWNMNNFLPASKENSSRENPGRIIVSLL